MPAINPPPSLWQLFRAFLRLGLTAFGGPAMVAYIRKLAVEQKGWLDPRTFSDGVALCQTIPGATAIQTAGYVGLKAGGVGGAAASFVGFGLPAFLLMTALAAAYTRFSDLPAVVSAFSGLQAIIVAIVAQAVFSFGHKNLKNWPDAALAAAAAVLFYFNLNPLLVILLAAAWGLVINRRAAQPPVATSSPDGAGSASVLRPLAGILGVTGVCLAALYFISPQLFDLSLLLMRIDLTAFGGGFASVPLMLYEIVTVRGWLDAQTFTNGIILGQITPGPIVITATFVGYLLGGLVWAAVATVSIFLPSFVILVGVSPYFDHLRRRPWFNGAISGVLCSFVGLLLMVTVRFAGNVTWDPGHLALGLGALAALLLKVDLLWVTLVGCGLSLVLFR